MSELTDWMKKQEKINIEAANAIKELEKKLEFVMKEAVSDLRVEPPYDEYVEVFAALDEDYKEQTNE